MSRTASRWLPRLTPHSVLVAVATATLIGTAGAASASVASAEPAHPTVAVAAGSSGAAKSAAQPARPAVKAKAPAKKAAKKFASSKQLKHSFQLQSTFYNCGPSAARVALSAHGKVYTQYQVGLMLGTTEAGTESAYNVTNALNAKLGKNRYHTVEIPGLKATAKQIVRLKTDVVTAISQGDPVVANVAGTFTDTSGEWHSYDGGHYIPIVGYSSNGDIVRVADSADAVGSPYYNMTIKDMADWIASRGYSA